MKLKLTLWISVALNFALLAGLVARWRSPASRANTPASTAAAPATTNFHSRSAQTNFQRTASTFRWSDVMSDDLKVYRDNLLAVACPRSTVRDIILGEINEQFGQRRQALLAEVQSRFWDCVLRGGEQAVREEGVTPFIAMKEEREKTINRLLGDGFGLAKPGEEREEDYFQHHFSWLPPEKRDPLRAAEAKRSQELKAWSLAIGDITDRSLSADELKRLQAIRKEYDDARKTLLTSEDEEEFRLRQSNESLWAADMSAFEATPEEWKAVTRARMQVEEARKDLLYSDLSDEERQKESDNLDAALIDSLKQTLGPERYADYARAKDDQYLGIYRVTTRYGLPQSVAVQAYEVQQSAAAQVDAFWNDPDLSPDARQKKLTTLRQETEQALAKTLGEKVLSTYKEYSGDWLKQLNPGGSN